MRRCPHFDPQTLPPRSVVRVFGKALLRTLLVIAALGPMVRGADPPKYAEAVKLVQQQHWREALADLDALKAAYPGNAKVLNLEGLALLGGGDALAAQRSFEQALQVSPEFSPAFKNLAILKWNNGLPGAVERIEEVLKRNPKDAVVNAYATLAALDRKDASAAAERFRLAGKAISILPPHLESDLAATLAKQRLYLQASAVFRDLIARGFDTPPIRYNLGLAQLLAGQSRDAVETLEPLCSARPTSENLNLLAQAYEKENAAQKAIDTLRQAIASDPSDENNYLDLSSLCIDHDLLRDADAVIQAGLARLPRSARLNFQAGLLHALSDEFDQANTFFERAAALEPAGDLPAAAMQLAEIQESRLPEAIQGLREKLRQSPNSAILWYLLGAAIVRNGAAPGTPAATEAASAFQKAMKLDPQLPFPYLELAKIYARTNRAQEAIPLLETAATHPSAARSAFYQLAMIYRQKGDLPRAKEMIEKVKQLNDRERAGTAFHSASVEQN